MSAQGTYFNANEQHGRDGHSAIIVVEGADDAYFVNKILEDIAADAASVRIAVAKGNGGIASVLSAIALSPDYTTGVIEKLVIVTDADRSEVGTVNTVHATLRRLKLPTPQAGGFLNDGQREVGLLVIPGNGRTGELADLLLTATKDGRLATVEACYDGIVADFGALPTNRSRSKRIAHMYMQVRPEDCNGIGRAYALGAFNDDARIEEIRQFLRSAM